MQAPARQLRARCCGQQKQSRWLSCSTRLQTDGVFRALTENRVQTPWIQALRKKQHDGHDPTKASGKAETPADRDLRPREMSDSYHSVILPLAQDPWLLDTYLNATGHIRLGTIFMDLDALSGVIAYKHTGDSVTTVTAACDRITINSPLTEICDLEYSGMVTYATGRSSMEISLQVAKAPKAGEKAKAEDILLTCQFTMVSLDPGTKKPVSIPPIQPETEEEHRLFEQGKVNSAHRKQLKSTSLLKQTPNDQESDLMHALWQLQVRYHDPNDALRKPDNVYFMDQTKLSTASIMQPQYRNRHHFMIFGGFLLKQTFELAFCCAASFAHARPTFVSLDPSTFQNPVPVGSVLYMTATIVYTDPPLIAGQGEEPTSEEALIAKEGKKLTRVQVRVDTKVRDVEHGQAKPTGQFNYTFTVAGDLRIMPRTYTEMMMMIEASRRARSVQNSVVHGEGDADTKERVTE
ncbi:HotDog domain-containing protein [Delphinella strobiligena]|nr:HotDog domain-containing protein [Delphinella strobiligena]